MEKAREATATPIQTVEPGKRTFRLGDASVARLRATTATVAPQSSAKSVEGEDTRAVSALRGGHGRIAGGSRYWDGGGSRR